MKNNNYSVLILVLLLSTMGSFSSCKDKEDDTPTSVSPVFSQSFTAKINGVTFSPEFVSGFLSEMTNTILITGSMADGEQIQLFVPKDVPVGEYSFSDPTQGLIVQAYYGVNDEDVGFARVAEDKMQVTAHSITARTISGTFSFESDIDGEGVFQITEGSFSVSY